MSLEIYHNDEADVNIVRGKIVAFIVYENQGRIQEILCLSLNDSFVERTVRRKIIAGVSRGDKYWRRVGNFSENFKNIFQNFRNF